MNKTAYVLTESAMLATARIGILQQVAASTLPGCASSGWGTWFQPSPSFATPYDSYLLLTLVL